jgi:DNA replicative helicase MCM subunit Mcm2 (Cdc46/Mcm family)
MDEEGYYDREEYNRQYGWLDEYAENVGEWDIPDIVCEIFNVYKKLLDLELQNLQRRDICDYDSQIETIQQIFGLLIKELECRNTEKTPTKAITSSTIDIFNGIVTMSHKMPAEDKPGVTICPECGANLEESFEPQWQEYPGSTPEPAKLYRLCPNCDYGATFECSIDWSKVRENRRQV